VRSANAALSPHQQIRGMTIWPDPDLPRTHTLKVRKPEVLARLAALESPEHPLAKGPAPLGHGPVIDVDPVTAIVASVGGFDPIAVRPESRLSTDLNLDSLRRVELLGVVEEELGVFVDDDALDADATVKDLIALIDAAHDTKRKPGSWAWPLSPAIRAVGLTAQVLLIYPFIHAFYRVRVTGLDRLDGVHGPILFTPNHCLHLDNAIILTRLPLGIRWKLSVAAGAETIYENRIQGVLASVIANAFPLAREGGVRKSLELLGARLDQGFNILIYPEGKLTVGGPLQPFKAGAGLIAVEGGTPIVPVKINIHEMSWIDRRRWPSALRGDVELVVGDPIWFDADTDHAAATTRLEAAVAAL
jgi:long-chain acyl-CoA synthetase